MQSGRAGRQQPRGRVQMELSGREGAQEKREAREGGGEAKDWICKRGLKSMGGIWGTAQCQERDPAGMGKSHLV